MNPVIDKNEQMIKELEEYNFSFQEIVKTNLYYVKAIFKSKNKVYLLKIINKKQYFDNKNLKFAIDKEIRIAKIIGNKNKYLLAFYGQLLTKTYLVLIYEYIQKGNLLKLKKKLNSKNKLFSINILLLILKDIWKSIKELKNLKIINVNMNIKNIFIKDRNLILGGYENCFINSTNYSNINYFFYKNNIINEFKYISPEFLIENKLSYENTLYNIGFILINLNYNTKSLKKKFIFQSNNYLFLYNKKNVKNILKNLLNSNEIILSNKFYLILNNLIEPNYKNRIKLNILDDTLNKLFNKIQFNLKEYKLRLEFFECMGSKITNYKKEKDSIISLNNRKFSLDNSNKVSISKNSSFKKKKFNFSISSLTPKKKKFNYKYFNPKKVKLTNNFFFSIKK